MAQVTRVRCSAHWKEGAGWEVQTPGPPRPCAGVSFLLPWLNIPAPIPGADVQPRPGPGEVPGAGNEHGQHPPTPPRGAGWGDPTLLGCLGTPHLTVLSCCRWGEEQLPDGQTQKYWVSVGG